MVRFSAGLSVACYLLSEHFLDIITEISLVFLSIFIIFAFEIPKMNKLSYESECENGMGMNSIEIGCWFD